MIYNHKNTEFLCAKSLNLQDVVSSTENIQKMALHNLFILSGGGSCTAGEFGLRNILPRNITTIGGEIVSSAAFTLFMCGKKRLVVPSSRIFFHESYASYEGRELRESELELKLEVLKHTYGYEGEREFLTQALERIRSCNQIIGLILSKRSTLSYSRIRKLMKNEGCCMGPKEALSYGFVHQIISESQVII